MSLALESPLAYLDFYEPTPSSNFVNDTKLPYTFYADNTQEDCYSDFEWDFESLPALEEISDLEDSGSSCSLFEFDDLESLGNGTESLDFTHINEFNTLYNHDRCQDTIEVRFYCTSQIKVVWNVSHFSFFLLDAKTNYQSLSQSTSNFFSRIRKNSG